MANNNLLGGLFHSIGGLLGDTVEVVKMGGSAIIDAPGQMIDGFNEGLIITPDSAELTQAEMEQVIKEAQAKKAAAAQAAAQATTTAA